jgi:hypothetical protein
MPQEGAKKKKGRKMNDAGSIKDVIIINNEIDEKKNS